jgi:predicted NUDIX family NTP pyrophosphohydrolase
MKAIGMSPPQEAADEKPPSLREVPPAAWPACRFCVWPPRPAHALLTAVLGHAALSRRTEVSAGILAFRRARGLEVLLAHPGGPYWRKRDEGAWSIPKGVVVSDDLLACARREFNEETGLIAEGEFVTLTPARQKSGKTVHAFALEADFDLSDVSSNSFDMEWPPRSGRMQSFPEVDRVAWFDLATARKKILPGQLPFIEELVKKLDGATH